MISPRGKSPLPEAQRRVELTTQHYPGQWAQHTTDWAILAPVSCSFPTLLYYLPLLFPLSFCWTRSFICIFLTIPFNQYYSIIPEVRIWLPLQWLNSPLCINVANVVISRSSWGIEKKIDCLISSWRRTQGSYPVFTFWWHTQDFPLSCVFLFWFVVLFSW